MKKLLVTILAFSSIASFAGEEKTACGNLGYWKINKSAANDQRTASDSGTTFSLVRDGKSVTFEVSKEDLLTVMQLSAASQNGLCVTQDADGSLVSFNN